MHEKEHQGDSVEAVLGRLRSALSLDTDRELAGLLGMAPNTLSNRVSRNSLPLSQIEALCASQGLNKAWVLTNQGPIYSGADELRRRLELRDQVFKALEPLGLPTKVDEGIRNLIAYAMVGNTAATIRSWNAIGSVADPKEKELLEAYRNSREELRDIFESLVTLSSVQRELGVSGLPSRMRGPKLDQTFHGNVGQVIHGDQKNDSPLSFNLSSKPKSKKRNKPAAE